MILAIDVGNTETDFGIWDGNRWRELWSRPTMPSEASESLENWLREQLYVAEVRSDTVRAIYGSVVPSANQGYIHAIETVVGSPIAILTVADRLGLTINYNPPESAGVDRIANALGALARFKPPIIVVDIGTATTFDVVGATGSFEGGAILAGPLTSANALLTMTAQLPSVQLESPPDVIGHNTVHAMQSGLVLGYAAAIDGLALQMMQSLGGRATVVATGGLAKPFVSLCKVITEYVPTLTLDGLVEAAKRLQIHVG